MTSDNDSSVWFINRAIFNAKPLPTEPLRKEREAGGHTNVPNDYLRGSGLLTHVQLSLQDQGCILF